MTDNAAILAALRGQSQDPMPFGVGGPAEPEVQAPGIIGKLTSGLLNVPKHLIDAAATAVPGLRREDVTDNPNAPEPNQPLYNAALHTAAQLAGLGAPAAEAGAAGIFGGRLAKTADLHALKEAESLHAEGVHPEEILSSTGWFRSPADQKWRFEIPDNNSRMLSHGLDYSKDGQFVRGPAEAMFQHPELYKAYPDLKTTPLFNTVVKNPSNGVGTGSYASWGPLEVNAPNLANARSVALHELQHGVQYKEGFAPGSNPNSLAGSIEKGLMLKPEIGAGYDYQAIRDQAQDLYHKTAGEVEARNVQRRMDFSAGDRADLPPWYTHDMPYQDQNAYDPVTNLVRALKNK